MAPILFVALAAAPITMIRLPSGEARAQTGEPELAKQGLTYAVSLGMLPKARVASLGKSLEAAYGELEKERGTVPTPAIDTLAWDQNPGGFDLVAVPPTAKERPDTAVIFLHGWGGNATLECWLAARAFGADGVLTVCPSMELNADWDSSDGRVIVAKTRAYLSRQGKTRLLLVGLSNGSVGACKIAARDESAWAGVACLEGTASPPKKLPVLLLIAKADSNGSPEHARTLAKAQSNITLAEIEGDHFAALERRDEVAKHLRAFGQRALP